ncbi:aminomethyl-transferring glycine dehydrogenase subunit GcvPB [Anaeromyxobacter paludicola]|uniref:Probable glycine dehydrogenase (decarboxylating) subunit 2 n=1 Tax=Anaeromyxobacter paludicola TaxID=2918171 RepID=A0ABM7X8F2_9BACT|nr:aminomethyl-transferring glycine dehydrogenase subunit GcvPB [Anaeromyxobacter paludicola]BDG08115.1 glycine dehydrogenase [Anaeromyxobacter paludicola]
MANPTGWKPDMEKGAASAARDEVGLGHATRGLAFEEGLLFERGSRGRTGVSLPKRGSEADPARELPAELLRPEVDGLPEVGELEVVRHFTRLSTWNWGIDTGFYPLGSCTMKYNPKSSEALARLPGFAGAHPLAHPSMAQGALELMYRLERALSEISGFDATSLSPAAGAQGELCGMMVIRAWHTARGNPRKKVLIPDTAHGTNPASSALNGYEVVPVKSGEDGRLHPDAVRAVMDEDVAAIMITNPNTLGIFETHIAEIAEIVHAKGGLVYGDGANMNALLGVARPGDMGFDVMQFNLHKTFATPHGGGGPGSGPVAVKAALVPFLPLPVVAREGERYRLVTDPAERPQTIGKLREFWGNFGMFVRAWALIRELGPDGLRSTAHLAVLNANYVRALLADAYDLPYGTDSLHEVVFTDKNLKPTGVTTMDVAKRLIDHGFHPPTVYFPLVVHGALMIEPTETESKETLERFCAAMRAIAEEAATSPEAVKAAPTKPVRARLDETRAARKPVLRWTPGMKVE